MDKRDESFRIEELKSNQCGALADFNDEKLGRIERLDAESTSSMGCE